MSFTINTLSGQTLTLSMASVLRLVGDAINDEVVLDGQVCRISSAQDVVPPSLAIDWVITPLPVTQSGQTVFQLPVVITDPESAFLTINNIGYVHGLHYKIQGDRLDWYGDFVLEPTDDVNIKYPITL
jgi:hypothetical protein